METKSLGNLMMLFTKHFKTKFISKLEFNVGDIIDYRYNEGVHHSIMVDDISITHIGFDGIRFQIQGRMVNTAGKIFDNKIATIRIDYSDKYPEGNYNYTINPVIKSEELDEEPSEKKIEPKAKEKKKAVNKAKEVNRKKRNTQPDKPVDPVATPVVQPEEPSNKLISQLESIQDESITSLVIKRTGIFVDGFINLASAYLDDKTILSDSVSDVGNALYTIAKHHEESNEYHTSVTAPVVTEPTTTSDGFIYDLFS